MSIVKPYTFVAGNKARANEVNADFDVLYQQVNANITDIAENASDIANLDSTKADINGNSTQRFAVADPVSSSDAVNKQTLFKQIGNSIDYIGGLTIEKDSGSPNDTILVNPGACYDSTKAVVLKLDLLTTKQNDNQGANTTYYVYIIGNSTGSSIDILISTSSTTPTLPSGYTLYRQIGYYTTNSSSNIDIIKSFGISSTSGVLTSANDTMPNMSKRVSIWSGYITPAPGYVFMLIRSTGNDPLHHVYVNGVEIYRFSRGGDYGGNKYQSYFFTIAKGDTVTWSGSQMAVDVAQFVYCKGW